MKREEFLDFIKHSEKIPSNSLNDFDEVIKMYPFFSGAHILLSMALNQSRDIRFPEALKNAALYSGDRKVLYNLHNPTNQKTLSKEPLITVVETIEETRVRPNSEEINRLEISEVNSLDIVSQILNYPEISRIETEKIEEEKREEQVDKPTLEKVIEVSVDLDFAEKLQGKHSFYEWLNQYKSENKSKEQIGVNSKEEFVQKEQLIERFIQTEPRISKPVKTEFFSPIIMAKKSVEDNDDIVSETLAKIYAEQGNIEKAIRIYQKLSLLYPDKSGYFAALIQKLENPDLI